MSDAGLEVTAAKAAIYKMLAEVPRPTQARIAAATGLSQGRVAKINKCDFKRLSEGVRRVSGYSYMTISQRTVAERHAASSVERITAGASRLAAVNPELCDVVAEFVENLASRFVTIDDA